MPLINRVGGGSAELQSKTVKSTTSQQTIEPDEGYDGISEITVSPIKLQSRTGTNAITPSASTQNITPSSLYDGLSKVEIKPIPSSYVQPNTTQGTKEWTPTTYDQSISAGTYCSGKQTIKGDSDLVSGNIKSGVNIFGVTGTYNPRGGVGNADSGISFTPGNRYFTVNVPTENMVGFIIWVEDGVEYDEDYDILVSMCSFTDSSSVLEDLNSQKCTCRYLVSTTTGGKTNYYQVREHTTYFDTSSDDSGIYMQYTTNSVQIILSPDMELHFADCTYKLFPIYSRLT